MRPTDVQSARFVDVSTTTFDAKPPAPQSTRTLPTGFTLRRSNSTVASACAERQVVPGSPSSSAVAAGSAKPFTHAHG